MASAADILVDAFERVQGSVHSVLDGLNESKLTYRIDPGANTIAWLIWHLTRGQDAQVSDVAGAEQLWLTSGWADDFDLPFDTSANGWGMSPEEVGQVGGLTTDQLRGYFDAVHTTTIAYVQSLSDDDLERIVDTRWNPPVTLAARLVSVVNDDTQHVGQAAFIKGVISRLS